MKVLSLHWGYSIGGVGKYASIIDNVGDYEDIHIKSLCIVSRGRQVDEETMNSLADKQIIRRESITDLRWYRELRKLVEQWKPDAIISHGFNGHFIAFIVKTLINDNIRFLCSYHGLYHATTVMRHVPGYFYNRFTEYFIRNVAVATVAVAEHCRIYLLSKSVNNNKVTTIHNGLKDYMSPSGSRDKYRRLFNISDDQVLLAVASRLDPVKGIEYLVMAFSEIINQYDNARLLIIGTGTLDAELKQMCDQKGMSDKVIFAGFRDDIPDCLSAVDIFVLPSLAEYHSIGLLEAMRAQKPIVATDVGGNTESVRHEKDGLIVEPRKSDQLEKAISRLIANPDQALSLSKSARQRYVENFTEDVMIRKTATWIVNSIGN